MLFFILLFLLSKVITAQVNTAQPVPVTIPAFPGAEVCRRHRPRQGQPRTTNSFGSGKRHLFTG